MDRDFHLSWTADNAQPATTLYTETLHGETYGLLMVTPPAKHFNPVRQNKEVIYIIDTSGSMGGESIAQAKASLHYAISQLHEGDRFNIIAFNNTYELMEAYSLYANHESRYQAGLWIDRLRAGGGTQMKPALLEAMTLPITPNKTFRQIVFITDGAVGNEQELMSLAERYLGDSRLFAVAIGSAPNRFLLRQLARLGKGSFIDINQQGEIQERMGALTRQINSPAITGLQLGSENVILSGMTPGKLPDVYLGEPLMVAMKLSGHDGSLTLNGETANGNYQVHIRQQDQHRAPGIAQYWARQHIIELEDRLRINDGNPAQLRQAIIDLSVKHHILTAYTALVAIDHQAVRHPDTPLLKSDIPNLLPKGSQWPRTALGLYPMYTLGLLLLACGALLYRRHAA